MEKTGIRMYSAWLVLALASAGYPLGKKSAAPAKSSQQVSDEALVEMARRLQRPAKAPLAKPAAPSLPDQGSAHPPVPGMEVLWDDANGTPRFLLGKGLRLPSTALGKHAASARPGARALEYFRANRGVFKLEEPTVELRTIKEASDALGRQHVVFHQYYQGIPVWGQEINAHFDRIGDLYSMNARYSPTPRALAGRGFRVGPAMAKAIAASDLSALTPIESMNAAESGLLEYQGPKAEKFVWMDQAKRMPHWAWHVSIRPNFRDHWYYFVDGESGAILEKYNATRFDGPATASATDQLGVTRTLNTYNAAGAYYLIDATKKTFNTKSSLPKDPKGALWTVDARNTDLTQVFQATSANNTWTDAAAVSAHYNMGRAFDYYLNTFNRLGIDGSGSTIISVVHVTDKGKKLDNAFWAGKFMAYGDGDQRFKPLARALDVAVHEMTHGVIENTVNLEYKFQSGALNESLSDVFGAMVDSDDWKLGEDVVNAAYFPSGAMRDMENPHNGGSGMNDAGWQPAHMDEFVQLTLDQDNGGVHVNSGITNRACFLLANAIGREKTAKIYYRVLDAHYLNSTSQFIDMRLGAIRAAIDLHGEGSAEVAAVKAAFDGVGIVDKASTPRPKDVPPVQGEDFVAIVNAEGGDNSLYIARPVLKSDTDIVQISETQVYTETGNPIAIPDDGSSVLFIDKSNALRGIDDDGEQAVSASGTWKSIAISPDGTKVAATTVVPDAKIYILDLVNPDASKTIALYTPTTGTGVKAENVVQADALDWNSTGEYLLYDAFNRVPQGDGGAVEYWDVNLLDVKNGIITPFLPSLPEGISIGNPSYAQTGDLNIVFDLYNANTDSYAVLAADMFTGQVSVIDSNGTDYGFPRYSTDDKQVVYQRIESGSMNLRQAPMAADRISLSGPSVSYIKGGQKPTWFAIGKRPAGIPFPKRRNNPAFSLHLDSFRTLRYHLPAASKVELSVSDLTGRLLAVLDRGRKNAGDHQARWGAAAAPGVYLFRLQVQGADGKTVSISRKEAVPR